MPTDSRINIGALTHPSDDDFLSLEDIVFGYTRYLSGGPDSESSEEDEDGAETHLVCPVCKANHEYVAPTLPSANNAVAEQYSHNARVIYASFSCPICLDEQAGPPMVVLPCGHALCQDDFRLLGGTTNSASHDAQVRQVAVQETTRQRREVLEQQQHSNNHNFMIEESRPFAAIGRIEEEIAEQISTALMSYSLAQSMHAFEEQRRQLHDSTEGDDGSDDADDEDYTEEEEEEEYGEDEQEDSPLVRWECYHPNNETYYLPPRGDGLPKTGLWMLVPNATRDTVSLMYYSEYTEHNPSIHFIAQCARGTKLVPNQHYGVYVCEPSWPSSQTADVYYAKNISSPSFARDPLWKFEIPRNAPFVSDGHGGLYVLYTVDTQENQNPCGSMDQNNIVHSTDLRRQRNEPAHQSCQLMRFNSRHRRGTKIGRILPQSSKIFMDKSGGVIILIPETESNFSSLWHFSHKQRLLLYHGIPWNARVFGDANGSSVMILSQGGRLQTILTRVAIRKVDDRTECETIFSYDLDLSMDSIKDIIEDASDTKEIFLHCRLRTNCHRNARSTISSGVFRWSVCRLSSEGNLTEIYACPKNSRILSDQEHGFWVWKKPRDAFNANDRGCVHVSRGRVWHSHRIFPPSTRLAGLSPP